MDERTPEEQQRWAEGWARHAMPWMFAGGTAPTVTYTPPEEPPVDGGAYRGPGFSITLPGEEPQHSYRVLRGNGEPASAEETSAFGRARSLDVAARKDVDAEFVDVGVGVGGVQVTPYDCGDCGAQEMHPGDVAPVGCDQAGGWMRKRAQEDADWAPLRALTDGELHDIIGDCQMTSHDEGTPVWFVTAEDLRASRERTTKTFGTTARMGWATYGDDE